MPDNTIKDLLITLVGSSQRNALAALGMSDHISALKSVLFSLDSHAQKMFEEQLAVEQKKSQRQFEELQMMLAVMQAGISRIVN